MTYQELLTSCAMFIALLSLLTTWVNKRGDNTKEEIKRVDREWKAHVREREERMDEDFRRIESRLLNLMERNAEISADVSQVKLEMVQSIVNVPTRDQLSEAIDRALAPVLVSMSKTERALERIYTSGILNSNRRDEHGQ